MSLEKYTKEYLETRKSISHVGELAPYEWSNLPKKLPVSYMAYSQMLDEHSRELANSINQIRRLIAVLESWNSVISVIETKEKYDLILEFIDAPATIALNFPYVVRSRFIYSIAHLCHQANRSKDVDWVDDLSMDSEIYFEDADKCGSKWKSYGKLKLAIEKIGNKAYQKETFDFRNKYNHRYSPKIEIGLTGLVSRIVGDDGAVSYGLGYTEPLKVSDIVQVLKKQHEYCSKAFVHYQKLVNEHTQAIVGA